MVHDERRTALDLYLSRRQRAAAWGLAEDWMRFRGIPDDLDGQSVDSLTQALTILDSMIHGLQSATGYPPDFDRMGLKVGPETEVPVDLILPLLRQRRSEILQHYTYVTGQEQMTELKGAVEAKVQDPQVRQELSSLVSEFAQQQREMAAKLQAQEDTAAQEMRHLAVQERKWRMRKSLLDREPAAVLIGGLLLLIVALSMIVAMFVRIPVPDILANAFLLILGFFFGQQGHRGRRPDDDAG